MSEPGEIKLIDVCFCFDVTGSMGPYIKASVETVMEVFDTLQKMYPICTFRLSFIGYRDFGDDEQFIVIPFTENIKSVRDRISIINACGGNDTPEDVAGALEKISNLDWKGDVKIIYFATDAPAHGTEYHPITMGDRYPRGDPEGRNPKKQVQDLASRGIDFTIFRVTPQIDTMIEQFDIGYKEGAIGFFTVLDIEKQLGDTTHLYDYDDTDMDRCLPSSLCEYESCIYPVRSVSDESCIRSSDGFLSEERCILPDINPINDIFKSKLIASVSASVERRK